ncbi:MAG: hypothetical protein WCC04_19050 [Terriglobales bacterium]
MIILVTYDLKGSSGSYTGLFDVLKNQNSWWHYLTNTWLIDTYETPEELFKELKPYIKTGDRILVTEFVRPFNGWLPTKAWEWINRHESGV